jgi:DNA end-binding protein Ku
MRPIWNGSVSFGLIHVPVNLYPAVKEGRISFHYLREKDLCPIGFQRVCKETGEVVPAEEIVKGYEYEKDNYVVLTDEDFASASVEKTETIEIVQFINADEVDSMLLEKPYYLEPTKGAAKVYSLLREALARSNRVGLARFVLKTREYLGIVKPKGDMIVLDQMRFQEEIRDASDLHIPEKAEINKKELDVAIQFIDELTAPFKSEEWHDTYNAALMELIEKKLRGEAVRRAHAPRRTATAAPDIMAQLKESLEMAKKGK